MKSNGKGSKPICWFCKVETGLDSGVRATAPDVIAPPSGVAICKETCPKLPEGAVTWRVGSDPWGGLLAQVGAVDGVESDDATGDGV
jgi:hypothetical protein